MHRPVQELSFEQLLCVPRVALVEAHLFFVVESQLENPITVFHLQCIVLSVVPDMV